MIIRVVRPQVSRRRAKLPEACNRTLVPPIFYAHVRAGKERSDRPTGLGAGACRDRALATIIVAPGASEPTVLLSLDVVSGPLPPPA